MPKPRSAPRAVFRWCVDPFSAPPPRRVRPCDARVRRATRAAVSSGRRTPTTPRAPSSSSSSSTKPQLAPRRHPATARGSRAGPRAGSTSIIDSTYVVTPSRATCTASTRSSSSWSSQASPSRGRRRRHRRRPGSRRRRQRHLRHRLLPRRLRGRLHVRRRLVRRRLHHRRRVAGYMYTYGTYMYNMGTDVATMETFRHLVLGREYEVLHRPGSSGYCLGAGYTASPRTSSSHHGLPVRRRHALP